MKTIQVEYIDTTKYKVRLHQELDDFDGPDSWGNFTLNHFSRDYRDHVSVDDITTEAGKLTPAFQAKLRAGKVFFFDIYEHSGISYSLSGEGMNCRFDTSSKAGYIEFEPEYIKNTSFEDRQERARQDLEQMNQFCNGDVYWVEIETEDGRPVDSLGGIYGADGVKSYIEEVIPGAEYEAVGIDDWHSSRPNEYEVSL